MRENWSAMRGWLAAAAMAGTVATAAWAQQPQAPPLEELGPPPKPISLYLADRPTVTLTFDGDYGPVRMTGTLENAPREPLRLTDPFGKNREAAWRDVRSLAVIRSASEGQPLGSFTVYLTSDAAAPAGATVPGSSSGYLSPVLSGAVGQGGWRLLRLPEGQLALNSDLGGRINIPTARILELYQQPVTGSVNDLPAGAIRLQVLPSTTVAIPLPQVQALRRDLAAGTATVTLADGQMVSGKIVELPRVNITFSAPDKQPPIPLDRVVQLEVRLPSARTLGSGMGL